MGDLLNQAQSRCLDDWLEALLMIGIEAAGLPPETTLEDLLRMNIPKAHSDPYPGPGETIAEVRCSEHYLFCSLTLAARLAGTQRAEQIRDCLQGLIWQDAVALGDAISYFQDLAASECLTDDAWTGQDRAEERWAPWESADGPARKAMDDFLYDYCDTQFLYRHKD